MERPTLVAKRVLPTQTAPLSQVRITDFKAGSFRGKFLRARVIKMTPVIAAANGTKYLRLTLQDETGVSETTLFGDTAEEASKILDINKLIRVERFFIRQNEFNGVQSLVIVVNSADCIKLEDNEDVSIPKVQFNFSRFCEVAADAADILGIIWNVSDLKTGECNGRVWSNRVITLTDGSLPYPVPVTLWGAEAIQFKGVQGNAIAILSAKITVDGSAVRASINYKSTLWLSPKISEATELVNWYEAAIKESDDEISSMEGVGEL